MVYLDYMKNVFKVNRTLTKMKNLFTYLGTFAGQVIITVSGMLVEKINKALTKKRNRTRTIKE